jgi:hypothetical protein
MPANGCGAAAIDGEAPLFRARRRARRGRSFVQLSARGDIQSGLAAGADHQNASDRHRIGGGYLHRFARPQSRQKQRGFAGIERRRHPGIDAVIRRCHDALKIEGSGNAPQPVTSRGEESHDQQNDNKTAQGIGIARGEPRRRQSGPQTARSLCRALQMSAP